MKKSNDKSGTSNLRKKAEKQLKKQLSKTSSKVFEADSLKLIHELEVHQIELEMQNEELMLAKKQAVIAMDKYIELYEFAPSSYVTLSATGKIDMITLNGASMLGKERSNLFYSNFNFFVTEDTLPVFNKFFEKVFISKERETCQVTLSTGSGSPIQVFIAGIISENGKQCHMSVMDISELKKT